MDSEKNTLWKDYSFVEMFQAIRSETHDSLRFAKAYCDLLLIQKPGSLNDDQIEMVKYVQETIERVDKLIGSAIEEVRLRVRGSSVDHFQDYPAGDE